MFKWLADMLVKTPVQGTCVCCEGKKRQLQKMQEAIMRGDVAEDVPQSADDAVMRSDSPEHEYTGKIFGTAYYGGYPVEVKDNSSAEEGCCCSDDENSSCCCGGHGCCHK